MHRHPRRRAAEEGDKDERERLMEPLALMQQSAASEPEEETVKTDDVVTGADVASAAIESTEDATERPRRLAVAKGRRRRDARRIRWR